MSVSGHKIGAPKGIGALYVKKGLRLPPLTFGGGQERGMRPGTEAVPNIAAFAKACEIRMAHFDEDYAHVQELADYLKQQVSAELPDAQFNGEGDIPHVVNLSMPGCKSEVMLHVLEGDEVYISSGSACSKGKQSGGAQGTRSAEGAHGQRAARFVCTVQHKGRCGCVCCSGQKGRENVPQIS